LEEFACTRRRRCLARFSIDDLKEIALQQAVYCGVPAATHGVRDAPSGGRRRQMTRLRA